MRSLPRPAATLPLGVDAILAGPTDRDVAESILYRVRVVDDTTDDRRVRRAP
jgi:hypothetical protein